MPFCLVSLTFLLLLFIKKGEQRSLASYFIKAAVETHNFLPKSLFNSEMMTVFLETLKHLPTTPVDGASDNKLRQMIFEHSINEDGDFSAAAAVLSGMRMDDDKDSIYYFEKADRADGKFKYLTSYFFNFFCWHSHFFICILIGKSFLAVLLLQ